MESFWAGFWGGTAAALLNVLVNARRNAQAVVYTARSSFTKEWFRLTLATLVVLPIYSVVGGLVAWGLTGRAGDFLQGATAVAFLGLFIGLVAGTTDS